MRQLGVTRGEAHRIAHWCGEYRTLALENRLSRPRHEPGTGIRMRGAQRWQQRPLDIASASRYRVRLRVALLLLGQRAGAAPTVVRGSSRAHSDRPAMGSAPHPDGRVATSTDRSASPGVDASPPPPILVVDDIAADATATAAALAADGYPTVTEHLGDAVLRRVRARLVRLVVSELYVPCAEGRCVAMCLKQERGRMPQVRVRVHSRHDTDTDRLWALDAGCDRLVPETAPSAVLLREVRRLDALTASHAPRASDSGAVHTAESVRHANVSEAARARTHEATSPPRRARRRRPEQKGDV